MNSGLKDTDRCVMCGLCLPHCPTYALSRNEGDSPRGRISLMQALASGRLEADARISAHLDGCLGCRACEAMCPSGVPFGRLMDEARALLHEQRGEGPALPALVRPLLRADGAGRAAASMLRVYQRTGIHALVTRLPGLSAGRLGRALDMLPRRTVAAPSPGLYRPSGDPRGRVYLFTGCTGAAFEGNALTAARDLLVHLGYEVEVAAGQGCCGALDLHSGHTAEAREVAERNLRGFGDSGVPVIALNSGCRTQLREYPVLVGEQAIAFSGRVKDLCGFLLEQGSELFDLSRGGPDPGAARGGDPVRPEGRAPTGDTTVRIAVHLPCTLRNVLREQGAMLELLRRVPGTEVVELDGNDRCCGAAGSHMITHPAAADALLTPKVEAVRRLAPAAIVTANIGCSLHFQAGLRKAGLDVPVLTPAEWILSVVSGQWSVEKCDNPLTTDN